MNAPQRRKNERRIVRRAEGIHPNAFPAKCPITGRPYFMTLDHPELGMVPTYGGPYDSFTIPHAEGEASQPWHERELVQHRYDHDAGGWLLDVVETIPLRIIHDDVRDRLEEAEETLKALGYVYDGRRWAATLAGDGSGQNQVSSMDADRGDERSDGGAADETHNGGER